MTFMRKIALAIVSKKTAAEMEAESRQWMMRCGNCGHEISVWDAGGLRYKAAGRPRRLWRCASCGKRTWHAVTKRGEPG